MPYTIADIPVAYRPKLEALKFNRGIPMSWLCAVCERTSWNPAFKTFNVMSTTSERQVGLSGIWWELPEVSNLAIASWTDCTAGWGGGWKPWAAGTRLRCGYCDPVGTTSVANLMDPMRNLDTATTILLECRDQIIALCGEVNAGVFFRWIGGCHVWPTKDAAGKCQIPTGWPGGIGAEVDALVAAQKLWAIGLGESPLVPDPCPTGQVRNASGVCVCPPVTCQSGFHQDSNSCQCVADNGGGGGDSTLMWGLLGLLGLLGIAGLAKKNKNNPKPYKR